MINWEQNPNWKDLPKPEDGDIVQLKLTDVFDYIVKAIVTVVNDNEIIANVEALFDWQTKGQLTGGDKLNLVGKQITFKPIFMQSVVKKPVNTR